VAGITNYLENELLDHVLRGSSGAYTGPTTVYLALYSAAPNDAGGGTEIGVTRQSITFSAASGGTISNSGSISFTSMPTVTVSHVGVFDHITTGNLLFHGALTSSASVTSGDTFTIQANDLQISLD
tara:strand:+ start:271 stop:648 length:378 start_codon:yes stop_codon:yes gene_type:complete